MNNSIFEPEPQDTKAVKQMHMSPLTKFISEMGPLAIYFFAYFRGDWLIKNVSFFSGFKDAIFPATAIFMVAAIISFIFTFIKIRKLPVMPLITGIVVIIFGLLALWLKNDVFIKMKPTIINSLFAAILFGGLAFKKSLLGYVFDSAFQLDSKGWYKLTLHWAWFFIFLAIVNETVWRNFSTETWMTFRFIGISGITFLFLLTQMPLIMRHSVEVPEKQKDNSDE